MAAIFCSGAVACQLEEALVLVDGFKRLRAARTLQGMNSLRAHFIEVDEQGAKAQVVYRLVDADHRILYANNRYSVPWQ